MMKKLQKKKNNKGFSLVELIVVIAIMAILVGVLAPTILGQIEKSRHSKDIQALDGIYSALTLVMADETAGAKLTSMAGTQTTLADVLTDAGIQKIADDATSLISGTGLATGRMTSQAFKDVTASDVKVTVTNGEVKVEVASKDGKYASYASDGGTVSTPATPTTASGNN